MSREEHEKGASNQLTPKPTNPSERIADMSIAAKREVTTDIEVLQNIPEELRRRRQWVVHIAKEPYSPTVGKRASSTDLMTWSSFEQAVEAYQDGRYDGVGFVFSSGDPFCGVDLDKCRNPETGEIGVEAQGIIDALSGYVEISPSGTGVHIIVKGKLDACKKRGWVEAYNRERYFTMTGRAL